MCPSYMASRDEMDSTRGRASALRAAMSGALPPEALTGRRLHEVMELCLECKACKAECPSNVDMAKLKYEFLDKYHGANGHSLRDLLFGHVGALSRWGSFFAPLSNWGLGVGPLREFLTEQAGIDPRRELPRFAGQTFRQWFRARGGSPSAVNGPVVLFPDTFTDYNHPSLGAAATRVLEGLGFQVVVPEARCCGRPMLSKGMMDRARRNAIYNVERLYPYVEGGAKVVGLEPSCILGFRDDFVDLLDGEARERAKAVGESVMLAEEFVLYAQEERGASLDLRETSPQVLFHGHCHQKALVGTEAGDAGAALSAGGRRGGGSLGLLRDGGSFGSRRSTTASRCGSGSRRSSRPCGRRPTA